MTSYLFLSICSITVRADRIAISCSPDRPPKITPTRSFIKQWKMENGKWIVGRSHDLERRPLHFPLSTIRCPLQYRFPQNRQDQFACQLDRDVALIEQRIDFDDLKGPKPTALG